MSERKLSWTQPCCERCWATDPKKGQLQDGAAVKIPTRVKDIPSTDPEQCSYCGYPTWAGIFIREDPTHVPYPKYKEE